MTRAEMREQVEGIVGALRHVAVWGDPGGPGVVEAGAVDALCALVESCASDGMDAGYELARLIPLPPEPQMPPKPQVLS